MSELRTLGLIKSPPKKKTLCWLVTIEDGAVFEVEGTAISPNDENKSLSVYDGNDLVFHNQGVDSVVLKDQDRVRDVSKAKPTPKKKTSHKAKPATKKTKVKTNG